MLQFLKSCIVTPELNTLKNIQYIKKMEYKIRLTDNSKSKSS